MKSLIKKVEKTTDGIYVEFECSGETQTVNFNKSVTVEKIEQFAKDFLEYKKVQKGEIKNFSKLKALEGKEVL